MLRAFEVQVDGWIEADTIQAANSAAQAKYKVWKAANDAGYHGLTFGRLRVKRASLFDPIAQLLEHQQVDRARALVILKESRSPARVGTWSLKRTHQCAKCPWKTTTDPHEIPNGYCPTKHAALESTIAKPCDFSSLDGPQKVMACHEMHDAHCIGWLVNQVGPGNNIAMRLRLVSCSNANQIKTVGPQHPDLRSTLPKSNQRRNAK